MYPLNLKPDQIKAEIEAFTQRLSKGIQRSSALEETEIGSCPREVVYREGELTLYRYSPVSERRIGVPLLIVYALVNRPYMLDLQANRSLIRGLLEAGIEVYLLDWGSVHKSDRYLTLDDYVNVRLDHCVHQVCQRHQVDALNLLGVCQGGTLSLCYTALHPQRVRNLITMVTPVDFHTEDNQLTRLAEHVDVDALVDGLGNIPGEMLNATFLSLKPFRLLEQKYVDLVHMLDDPVQLDRFLLMERWIFDSPDQAGEAFRQFIKDLYQQNKLVKGGLEIGGLRVDLEKIRQPVLNIFAEQDHLVPPDASKALGGLVGTQDYTELSFRGGHIGIYVSGRAQSQIPSAVFEWLALRDQA